MKKLKLEALEFQGAEVLTREQLKKILGGGMMGTTDGGGTTGTGTDPGQPHICYCYSLETPLPAQWIAYGDCADINALADQFCKNGGYSGGECGAC